MTKTVSGIAHLNHTLTSHSSDMLPTQSVFLTQDLRSQNSIAPLDMTWSPRNKWSPVVSPTTMATVRCLDLTTMMMMMLIHPKIPKRWRVRKQTSTWWMQVQRPHHLEPHGLWKCLGKQEDIGFEVSSVKFWYFFGKGNRFNTFSPLWKKATQSETKNDISTLISRKSFANVQFHRRRKVLVLGVREENKDFPYIFLPCYILYTH